MENVLRLFLVRTLSVTLLILGASILGLAFPTTPRQAGILALLTVGLPALVLAVWAKPQRTGRYLLPAAAPFVLPSAITIALLCTGLYFAYQETTGDTQLARTMATELAVLCGLLLVPFAESDVGAGGHLSTRRPLVLLTVVLAGLFAASLLIDPLRDLYELEALDAAEYLLLVGITAAWGAVMWLLARVIGKRNLT
jgi:hypothetical protein